MLDKRKKFEFSIESSVGQEQDWSHEPDQRHAERIISELELETCKSVSTPRVRESVSATRAMIVEGVELDDKEARRFRALAARLNCLAGDWPDLLFASKCICKDMARPRSEDWLALKRVGADTSKERREWCSNSIGQATTPISTVTPTRTGQETVRT